MTEAEYEERIGQIMVLRTEGCCMNDAWRGRLCSYHQGLADGFDEAWQILEAGLL